MDNNYDKKMPCKDCPNRYVGCHDHCERYLQYKKDLEEQKARIRKAKEYEDSYWLIKKEKWETRKHRK